MIVFFHILLIALSNYLVQFPFELWGYHTTYGAFTYPFIFILSDLVTRFFGAIEARSVIFKAMVPGFLISFLLTMLQFKNIDAFTTIARISGACFLAYVSGQLLDIYIFSKLRNIGNWYVGPMCSSMLSNTYDTFIFFFLAFYHAGNPFMASHWVDFATTDLVYKLIISTFAFIPLYGLLLKLNRLNKINFFQNSVGQSQNGSNVIAKN
jgi:hypothetical protein